MPSDTHCYGSSRLNGSGRPKYKGREPLLPAIAISSLEQHEGLAFARSELLQTAAATAPLLPNSPRLIPGKQQFSADLVERVSPAVVSVKVDVER